MNKELDPNVIAAEFLKQNLDALFDGAKSFFKEAADKLRLNLDRTYRQYLTTLLEKYSKAKSFLLRGDQFRSTSFMFPWTSKAKTRPSVHPASATFSSLQTIRSSRALLVAGSPC